MDLDLVRHALAAARKHGYAEVELGEGAASFTARLARAPKAAGSAPTAEIPVEDAPKAIRATLVGYWRDGKEALAVGRNVRKGDVVGMVEALGIVTDVSSPVDGEVIEVMVEAGQAVQYGQALAQVRG